MATTSTDERSCYETLGVEPTATHDEIRRAYHRLVRSLHPDAMWDATPAQRDAAGHRLAEVNVAYETLEDPRRRATYDLRRTSARTTPRSDSRPGTSRPSGAAGTTRTTWRPAATAATAAPDGFVLTDAAFATLPGRTRVSPPLNLRARSGRLSGLAALRPGDVRRVSCAGHPVTDDELRFLAPLHDLRRLDLGHTPVSDEGVARLCGLARLEVLSLAWTGITDDSLATLRTLPQLVYLDLSGTAVTDAGLAHLLVHTRLRTVALWSTNVTWRGLRLLDALPEVTVLSAPPMAVLRAGVDRLLRASSR